MCAFIGAMLSNWGLSISAEHQTGF